MHLSTLFSLVILFLHPLLAQGYASFSPPLLEIRAPTKKSSSSSSSLSPKPANVNKPLPALPQSAAPLPKSNSISSTKSTQGHAPLAAPNIPVRSSSLTPSSASHDASTKPSTSGASKKSEPYKRPNLIAEMEAKNKDKPVPAERKWYQRIGDSFKNIGKSKDQRNYDKLHGDPFPNSTPHLKKLINKEAEITTGTTANRANLEKFQRPRYEAKFNRIKPMGDVATAELAVHNNKYKEVKDAAQVVSQATTTLKTFGVPLRRRSHMGAHGALGVRKRSLIMVELARRALQDEDIWL